MFNWGFWTSVIRINRPAARNIAIHPRPIVIYCIVVPKRPVLDRYVGSKVSIVIVVLYHDSKVHGASVGPHVGHMNFDIWVPITPLTWPHLDLNKMTDIWWTTCISLKENGCSLIQISLKLDTELLKHAEAGTKSPPFCRRHFSVKFVFERERKNVVFCYWSLFLSVWMAISQYLFR